MIKSRQVEVLKNLTVKNDTCNASVKMINASFTVSTIWLQVNYNATTRSRQGGCLGLTNKVPKDKNLISLCVHYTL